MDFLLVLALDTISSPLSSLLLFFRSSLKSHQTMPSYPTDLGMPHLNDTTRLDGKHLVYLVVIPRPAFWKGTVPLPASLVNHQVLLGTHCVPSTMLGGTVDTWRQTDVLFQGAYSPV